uniref:Nuclear receptor domain-containing protein n=1 Tax=Caenorhabditis japonica TaxID=281687 RepID=A0A8R1E0E2_CAEJA
MTEVECAVCRAPSNGFHFGVEVCSACSSFFRRTVAKNLSFKCWRDGKCEIISTSSPLCKRCRFEKCMAVGMNKDMVQHGREGYGSRETPLAVSTCSPMFFNLSRSEFQLLDTIMETYSKVEKIRIGMHQQKNESFFEKRAPKSVSYKESIEMFVKEFYMVGDWLSHCFPDFAAFPPDQKDILHRSFYLQFVVLESGYFSIKNKRTDIRYLPSGDYVDCTKPETYYVDPEGFQPIKTEDAPKMCAANCHCFHRNVTFPMIRENTNLIEFLALTGLALFDPDLESISISCAETCRKNRSRIQRELLQYYMSTMSVEEASIRFANIFSIIPNLQILSSGLLNIHLKSAHHQKATIILSDEVDPMYLVLPVILPENQELNLGGFIVDFNRLYTVSILLDETPRLGLNSSAYHGKLTPIRGTTSPSKLNLPLTGVRFDFECDPDFHGEKCSEQCQSSCTPAPTTPRDLELKVDYTVNPTKLEAIVEMLKKENEIENSFSTNGGARNREQELDNGSGEVPEEKHL